MGNVAVRVAYKDYAIFIKCITKIGGATIDDAKDLDLAMSMCNLIELMQLMQVAYRLIQKMKQVI